MQTAHFLAAQQVEKAVFRCLNYLLLLGAIEVTAALKNNARTEWPGMILGFVPMKIFRRKATKPRVGSAPTSCEARTESFAIRRETAGLQPFE